MRCWQNDGGYGYGEGCHHTIYISVYSWCSRIEHPKKDGQRGEACGSIHIHREILGLS